MESEALEATWDLKWWYPQTSAQTLLEYRTALESVVFGRRSLLEEAAHHADYDIVPHLEMMLLELYGDTWEFGGLFAELCDITDRYFG